MNLDERVRITTATRARFFGQPFDWRRRSTCIHMVREHAKAMGHKPPKVPPFRSPLAAQKVLTGTGHQSLESLMDAHFERIAPSRAIVGDVIMLEGVPPFGGLGVCLGNGRLLGWHPDAHGACIVQPHSFIAAWRL